MPIYPPEDLERRFEERLVEYYTTVLKENPAINMKLEEFLLVLDKKARELFERVTFYKRYDDATRFEEDLKSEFIKIMHDTNPPEFSSYIARLAESEKSIFGYSEEHNPQIRPKYGYVTDRSDGKVGNADIENSFGTAVTVCFRDDIKFRANGVVGDLLRLNNANEGLLVRPISFTKPDGRVFPMRAKLGAKPTNSGEH
jgi:hypothetical protein